MTIFKARLLTLAETIKGKFTKAPPLLHKGPVPLSAISQGARVTIRTLTGDRKTCAQISAMGLYPGAEGEMLSCFGNGQCILDIHGCRLCIDREIASQVMVAMSQ